MQDDIFQKGVIQLLEPKRLEEVGRTGDPKYCRYHRIVNHALEKCIRLKERIMLLIDDGTIMLDLDDMVETNHVSCQTMLSPATQERSFPVNVFDNLQST